MAYKTKKLNGQVDLRKPLGGIPTEEGVTLKINKAIHTASDSLMIEFVNSFGEKIKDKYNINSPRHHFLLAAAYEVDEMKEIVAAEDWTHLAGKEITVDIIKEQGAKVQYDPRSHTVQLLDKEGKHIVTGTYEEVMEQARRSNIALERNSITNHRSTEDTSSKLPKEMRF